MARPPRYDVSRFLDAAVELAAAAGPSAVTMAAVAKAVGAPSGSVYHRFPGRPALLAEVWLRTVEGFQEGWFAALGSGGGDPRAAARAAAVHVVAWSRTHPREAALLLYGAADFAEADWPAASAGRAAAGHRRVGEAVAGLCAALGAEAGPAADRVALAVIDMPLTIVRRQLRRGQELPAHAEELAGESALLLLGAGPGNR
ncbi:TetR/AcrR family transcriptional regulator [Streptomyces flavofungini]|uniref:TetR/AcrR family transcriptional regulator n=1 Tax=Streptomyces flavofungini TaxID=68200 RepID=A0ABS0X504_9ACTN|nr:TetR/AcrR family transcriptional regulator [Streptomyces flavofungini]MBJ3808274.1 TetR/AcrR family transcriptional regulator [Streptomyces flavofungini]GHC57544.1 putative transcriptional regulator, TetR family protein [Streptomyces flavofungini]